jgi:hypothetical protein
VCYCSTPGVPDLLPPPPPTRAAGRRAATACSPSRRTRPRCGPWLPEARPQRPTRAGGGGGDAADGGRGVAEREEFGRLRRGRGEGEAAALLTERDEHELGIRTNRAAAMAGGPTFARAASPWQQAGAAVS